MAKTEEDLDLDVTKQAAPEKKRGMKKIIIIAAAAVVLLSGIGAGAWFFMHKSADADSGDAASGTKSAEAGKHGVKSDKKDAKGKKEKKDPNAPPAVYLALDPAFVVNFEDQGVVRFLQITVEVGTHDPLVLDAVKLHMPIIRNNLVMLFSNLNLASVTSREGKEKLRADALLEVQKVLQEQTGEAGVENIYFTSFVMQ
jgi:flagellar FliL protein